MKRTDVLYCVSNATPLFSPILWAIAVVAMVLLFPTVTVCQEQKPGQKNLLQIPPQSLYASALHDDRLGEDLTLYVVWDERQFEQMYDRKQFETATQKDEMEAAWIKVLEGREPLFAKDAGGPEFYKAINGLAFLKSKKAIPVLLRIGTERVTKDNAFRHNSIKALGHIGDPVVVPDLIPMLYHFNFNCRFDAQVSLVRLTGQNFGSDWEAWGKWWNEHRDSFDKKLPAFDMKRVEWAEMPVREELESSYDAKVREEIRKYCDAEFQKKTDLQFLERQRMAGKPAPKIIKTFPENQAKNVDPNISQVYVVFDVPMGDGRAWAQRGDTALDFNEADAPAVFWAEDKKTSVASVKLQPNKKYEVLMNFRPFIGFVSTDGVPSAPFLFTFETGDGHVDEARREKLSTNLIPRPQNNSPPQGENKSE